MACTNCKIGTVAMQIYDFATNEAYYISSLATKDGKPVYVSEFGATRSDSQGSSAACCPSWTASRASPHDAGTTDILIDGRHLPMSPAAPTTLSPAPCAPTT
ncbi:hypothetical protein B0H21DRAFT_829073 [Amylocystis lapponica]|nr:hypothetical protein B0H21DRAFT_829073 [Amylocystis lapponica]